MFKSARWRSEKGKIKAVFKLQFRATQVVGDAALMLSVVPADVGKPTLKLEKATIRDGSCCWENAVYETVKLNRDPKSGKIHERIYTFVVGTGSSKSGVVGEASIDFSSYAETTKVSSLSLPLKNSKPGAILHVSIQRINDPFDPSIIRESVIAKPDAEDRTLKAQISNEDMDASFRDDSVDETLVNKNISAIGKLNGRKASSESDITLSGSESSSGLDTPRELQMKNGNACKDQCSSLSSDNDASLLRTMTVSGPVSEWLQGGATTLDGSTTDDSSSTSREANTSPDDVEKLRSELVALARQAEVSDLELQTLRKQIMKESKRGHDLSREIVTLKEERDAFKDECERLKASRRRLDDAKSKDKLLERGDVEALVHELRQELNYQKDLNANLQIQLEKTQESNSELILAVRDLDEMLEQKEKEIVNLSSKSDDDDNAQKALERLVKQHGDVKEAYLLEQKITDLENELEIYRRDKDELEMQMEQLALDYEILKQENHDVVYKLEQSQLQEQLKMQYECSASYATVSELEAQIEGLENELKKQSDSLLGQVKSLEEELEKQGQGFEADLEALSRAKVEQEQRAIRAEEALRKTRWRNAKAAERLQEEFMRLSEQMTSTFEANEKLATKALTEANELHLHKRHLEETLQRSSEELQSAREHYEARLLELSGQIRQMQSEIEAKSMQLENEKKHNEETQECLANELEETRKTIVGMESMLKQHSQERSDLENRLALMHKNAEESSNEKDILESEMNALRARYNELNTRLSADELEKDKLRKQVSQLKGDLKKKEDALNSLDKKLKDANNKSVSNNGTRAASRNNKLASASQGLKEVTSLKEKIKLLEGQIKLKESALETSTNSFLEKEKDLRNKIEDLETRLEELNQNTARLCEQKSQKVAMEDRLLKEVMIQRERNESMEEELKEMQERYSEISLRFAEVEGERQQLVMKLRNLKNAKKNP